MTLPFMRSTACGTTAVRAERRQGRRVYSNAALTVEPHQGLAALLQTQASYCITRTRRMTSTWRCSGGCTCTYQVRDDLLDDLLDIPLVYRNAQTTAINVTRPKSIMKEENPSYSSS